MIHEMQQDKIHAGVFFHPEFEELKKAFFKKFTIIKAGGGLVKNEKDETLLIFRRGKWDLPKGKLDPGETIEECAVREVKEETGLKSVSLVKPLIITYHTYHEGSKFILKESHWFEMKSEGNQPLKPQLEEDIHEIKWVSDAQLKPFIPQTFPSIGDVLKTRLPK
jgi:8-oxo-dGTP pyrophosphatase MutT (NUDIX family)